MRLFRKQPAPQTSAAGEPASARDVVLVYRLVLRREPDPDGLSHYAERLKAGLTVEDLIRELMDSEERRRRLPPARPPAEPSQAPPVPAVEQSEIRQRIAPEDFIRSHSLEELNRTADDYYRRIADPLPLFQKPFAFLQETPEMLENLGALLRGLELGKTMTVLDFGAGTCWLGRLLTELNCEAICCDVSPAALDMGRRLFADHPPIGRDLMSPTFLPFDGTRLELPDESVDRIICFDAFHHVANQADVLAEFCRILRPGGIAGFSEPGFQHSRTPQAQYEMHKHHVLENDIDLRHLFALARQCGFTDLRTRVLTEELVAVETYTRILDGSLDAAAEDSLQRNIRSCMASHSIFFLSKGPARRDSRSHIGLAHRLEVVPSRVEGTVAREVSVSVRLENTGTAAWLHRNNQIYGTVRIGTHLYDAAGTLIEVDHSRHSLPRSMGPGDACSMDLTIPVPPFSCRLELDLVSEGVRWFENEGSAPAHIDVVR